MSIAINHNYIASAFKGTLELWNPTTYIRSVHDLDSSIVIKKLVCCHKSCLVLTADGKVLVFNGLTITNLNVAEPISDMSSDGADLVMTTFTGNFIRHGKRGRLLTRAPPPLQVCLGPARMGHLAGGKLYFEKEPIRHPSLITSFTIGGGHTVFIDSSNALYGFGKNLKGQLGRGIVEFATEPILLPFFSKAVKVAAGREHTVVLDSERTAWMTGSNHKGQFGPDLSFAEHCHYGFLIVAKGVVDIAAIGDITILLLEDGDIVQLGTRM